MLIINMHIIENLHTMIVQVHDRFNCSDTMPECFRPNDRRTDRWNFGTVSRFAFRLNE